MSTQLDLWNRSISYLDMGQFIASLTENSPQARACGMFYDAARKFVLERCYWTNATKALALSLLLDQESVTTPSAIIYPGWRYVYARPNDCLKAQCVTTQYGIRTYPWMSYWWQMSQYSGNVGWGPFRPAWTEMQDQINTPAGQSIDILTDQSAAWLVYTTDVPNIAIMPESLTDAIAWQLSAFVGGPLSANQKAKEMALKMAPLSLSTALAQNLNEMQEDKYPDSPSIQCRN